MTTINGSYTTDLQSWVTFGTERVENAIRSIHRLSGLVLSGQLTEADCETIYHKKDSLVYLDLRQALLPSGIQRSHFLQGATRLSVLKWPGDTKA